MEHPLDEASATDNCGEVSISVESIHGACAGDYTITRTFTATDDALLPLLRRSRLLIRLLQYLRSQRTTQRSVLMSIHWMKHQRQTTVEVISEEVTTPGACAETTITRTFTATDDCGNATTATQTITIVDTTAPFTFVQRTTRRVF